MKSSTFIEPILFSIHIDFHLSAWLVFMEICLKNFFISISHLSVQIKFHKENISTKRETSYMYSEPSRTSKIELFAKILNDFQLLLSFFSKPFYIDAYSKPSRTSEMELFAKLVNSFYPSTTLVKSFILEFDWVLNTHLVKITWQ